MRWFNPPQLQITKLIEWWVVVQLLSPSRLIHPNHCNCVKTLLIVLFRIGIYEGGGCSTHLNELLYNQRWLSSSSKFPRLVGVMGGSAYMHVYMTNGRYHTVSMLSREVRRTLRTRDGGGGTSMASILTIVGADHLCWAKKAKKVSKCWLWLAVVIC